jgi:hypothetical protein
MLPSSQMITPNENETVIVQLDYINVIIEPYVNIDVIIEPEEMITANIYEQVIIHLDM